MQPRPNSSNDTTQTQPAEQGLSNYPRPQPVPARPARIADSCAMVSLFLGFVSMISVPAIWLGSILAAVGAMAGALGSRSRFWYAALLGTFLNGAILCMCLSEIIKVLARHP